MALPRGATGSLRPTFVSARAVALAVRRACAFALEQPMSARPAPTAAARPGARAVGRAWALALEQPMSDRPEPTVARLRYALGGDRPSQTARQAGFRPRLTGPGSPPDSGRG